VLAESHADIIGGRDDVSISEEVHAIEVAFHVQMLSWSDRSVPAVSPPVSAPATTSLSIQPVRKYFKTLAEHLELSLLTGPSKNFVSYSDIAGIPTFNGRSGRISKNLGH
jgi:hypothetical protein